MDIGKRVNVIDFLNGLFKILILIAIISSSATLLGFKFLLVVFHQINHSLMRCKRENDHSQVVLKHSLEVGRSMKRGSISWAG